MTNSPPLVKTGDTIGVFSPSSWVDEKDIALSRAFLEERGYKVFIHPQTLNRHHQSAGLAHEKLSALYDLWDNPEISCIWAAGGGNRMLHWLDNIDFTRIRAPKAVIGFSDVTALLNALYAHNGLITYHGPTFGRLHKNPQSSHLLDLLAGNKPAYDFTSAHILVNGEAQGPLIGGNLSLFQYLPQTLPGQFWENSILFLEDCNEELSRVDRMMAHLQRLGVFKSISGLILGQFGDVPDSGKPYGFSLEDIVLEHLQGRKIPVITHAPFGHERDLYTFSIGQKCRISATGTPPSLTL